MFVISAGGIKEFGYCVPALWLLTLLAIQRSMFVSFVGGIKEFEHCGVIVIGSVDDQWSYVTDSLMLVMFESGCSNGKKVPSFK